MPNSAQAYDLFNRCKLVNDLFKAEEAKYLLVLNKLLRSVSEESDYKNAFITYNKIKDEGNDNFKRQVKFKMGLHLLAVASCEENIAKDVKLIIEAERLEQELESAKKENANLDKKFTLKKQELETTKKEIMNLDKKLSIKEKELETAKKEN
ncbi:9805_t:CDS:2, partial [Dentiscutata heterogama]